MHQVKKMCSTLVVFLTLATSVLSAYQDDNFCVPASCCPQPACCESTGRFFARGDFLYWTPRITGLELNFGTTEIAQDVIDCTQVLATNEVDLDPSFKWDAGYRAGIGYEGCNWGAEVLWTHFQGNGTRNRCGNKVQDGFGKAKITLDQIDLALGYNTTTDSSFNFKPFVGVRATRIHQHVRALLFTNILLSPESEAIETKAFDDRQKYWGVGPLFGVQSDWEIGCGFGLYGTVAASVLYGEYKVHFEDTDVFTAPISKQFFSDNNRHTHSFDYNIDLALGISWHTTLCNKFEVAMKLGFEQHQYFNQNHLAVDRGDVSFTGGVFSLEVGF